MLDLRGRSSSEDLTRKTAMSTRKDPSLLGGSGGSSQSMLCLPIRFESSVHGIGHSIRSNNTIAEIN